MKEADKDKPIPTIPKGVWESSRTDQRKRKSKKEHMNEITTDAQGNGYPASNITQKEGES